MNSISRTVSLLALAATLIPCLLYFFGVLSLEPMKWTTLVLTIVWFATTPLWIGRENA